MKINSQYLSGSLDADKLFNKVTPATAEEYLRRSVLKSDWKLEINLRELKVFLATMLTEEEIDHFGLKDIIPRRRSNKGCSPKLIGAELNVRPNKPGESKFVIKSENDDSKTKRFRSNDVKSTVSIIDNKQIDIDIDIIEESNEILKEKIKNEAK